MSARRSTYGPLRLLRDLALIGALVRLQFGGEDPLEDPDDFENWHHRGISYQAARLTGWADSAAKEVSWHADYVDSYLYNPLWWIQGGLGRLKTSLSLAPPLTNVHFDDLNSTDQIRVMWRRYHSGTVAGVHWAHHHADPTRRVAAARHIVGVALHAVQDFYSHSTWVDDRSRRNRTWSDLAPADRNAIALVTGTYEGDEHTGVHHHGKYSIGCSLLRPIGAQMDIVCHALSPFSNTAICEVWKSCGDAVPIEGAEVLGVSVPGSVVYLDPPGIALDNTWLSQIGAQQRGFPSAEGATLFASARRLAIKESCQFLGMLRATMDHAGLSDFWHDVESTPALSQEIWEAEYEDFHRQGLHFIGTGTYPPDPATPEHEWFLRLRIRTAAASGSGTDADIYAVTDLGNTKLDTMAGANPLIAYNDFEAGDDQVFHIGPFDRMPTRIGLYNDAADIGDVFVALGRAFLDALDSAGEAVVDFLLSLIGGHADHVATNKKTWTPAELASLGSGPRSFTIRLNGRSEGDYEVRGTITRTRRSVTRGRPVSDYAVHLDELYCRQESDWDRGSSSDEPFLYTMLINQASRTIDSRQFGPYSDVDTGDTRKLGRTLHATGVPDSIGYLTLPIQVMESDDEGSDRRREGFDKFREVFTDRTEPSREGFIATLGRALGADWKVASLEVDAYRTGEAEVVSGRVLDVVHPGWIPADSTRNYGLSSAALETIILAPPTIEHGALFAELGGVDFEGDGQLELFARSPSGVGVLGFDRSPDPSLDPRPSPDLSPIPALDLLGLADLLPPLPHMNIFGGAASTSLSIVENGAKAGAWDVNTVDNHFGPVGDFDGDGKQAVLARSPWGIGALGLEDGDLVSKVVAPNGTPFGGWVLQTGDNRFGPAGDFDGDDQDEVLVTSGWGMALLRLDAVGSAPLAAHANGQYLGEWLLHTRDNQFGPAGDFDGDRKDEIVVTSPWGIAVLGFDGVNIRHEAMAQNGTTTGDWTWNTADCSIGPAGDFDNDGRDEFIVTSSAGMALIGVEHGQFVQRAVAWAGDELGEWILEPAAMEVHGSGAFAGNRDQVFVSSPRGIGILGLTSRGIESALVAGTGASIDGWNLDMATNRFSVVGRVTADSGANVLVTSGWGIAILGADPSGLHARFVAKNGVQVGDWLLNTPEDRLG